MEAEKQCVGVKYTKQHKTYALFKTARFLFVCLFVFQVISSGST